MRVVIAVTHLDEIITHLPLEDEEKVTEATIKEKVCSAIKCSTEVQNFSEDLIIPVSGLWAFYSRLLESSEKYRDHAIMELKKCPPGSIAVGQNENLDQLPSTQVARMLEKESGIQEVEKR